MFSDLRKASCASLFSELLNIWHGTGLAGTPDSESGAPEPVLADLLIARGSPMVNPTFLAGSGTLFLAV